MAARVLLTFAAALPWSVEGDGARILFGDPSSDAVSLDHSEPNRLTCSGELEAHDFHCAASGTALCEKNAALEAAVAQLQAQMAQVLATTSHITPPPLPPTPPPPTPPPPPPPPLVPHVYEAHTLQLSYNDGVAGSVNVGGWTHHEPFGFRFTAPASPFILEAVDISIASVITSGLFRPYVKKDEGGQSSGAQVAIGPKQGMVSGTNSWTFEEAATLTPGEKYWVTWMINNGGEANAHYVGDNAAMDSGRFTSTGSIAQVTAGLGMGGIDFKARVRGQLHVPE